MEDPEAEMEKQKKWDRVLTHEMIQGMIDMEKIKRQRLDEEENETNIRSI